MRKRERDESRWRGICSNSKARIRERAREAQEKGISEMSNEYNNLNRKNTVTPIIHLFFF